MPQMPGDVAAPYKFENATREELEQLREFIDSNEELSPHVEADIEYWLTGHWSLNGSNIEFLSMGDMLAHLKSRQ